MYEGATPTWLRMSVAFLALMKSGVSVAKANIPFPLISSSSAFLYSLCEKGVTQTHLGGRFH